MAKNRKNAPTYMFACPHCNLSFSSTDLKFHTKHCPQSPDNKPRVRPPFSARKREHEVRLAAQSVPPEEETTLTPTSRTKDGYVIDRCWQCKRRICLMPTKHSDRVHEIDWRGYAADRHCCDGPDGTLDSLDRADSFSSQRAVVAIRKQIRFGPKKRS
jgi:hypothetical protein